MDEVFSSNLIYLEDINSKLQVAEDYNEKIYRIWEDCDLFNTEARMKWFDGGNTDESVKGWNHINIAAGETQEVHFGMAVITSDMEGAYLQLPSFPLDTAYFIKLSED